MARHKNLNWNLSDGAQSWESVHTALLMDIRDELQRVNRVLACPDFLNIPYKLDTIVNNTKKSRRRKTCQGLNTTRT